MINVNLCFPNAGVALVVPMPTWPEVDQILSFENALKTDAMFGPYVDKKWRIAEVEHRFGKDRDVRGQPVMYGFTIVRLVPNTKQACAQDL